MASYRALHFVLFFLLLITASSALSSSIKLEEMLEAQVVAAGSSRFKPVKPCPVDFEQKDYTNLTRTCRKPYKAQPCCTALKKIACPHMEDLNDLTTDCALSLFSTVDYHGNYPTGLFAMMCVTERKKGMNCDGY